MTGTRPLINEIINGTAQLERLLVGIHPRLFMTADTLATLRSRLGREPYAALFARVCQVADEALNNGCPTVDEGRLDRGHGCALPHLALAYLLTEDVRYLDGANRYFHAVTTHAVAGQSLMYGHILFGMSVAYDWLFPHLDAETERRVREWLFALCGEVQYEMGVICGWAANIFTCNHLPVNISGLLAAGAALYGEMDGCAPFLRLSLEKFRQMTAALGPDGASQAGLGYGEYYAEFYLKGLVLLRDLMNQDFFTDNDWLRNTPAFYLYSGLPRSRWSRRDCAIFFGDSVRHHWYGPDTQLRLLASVYRDGVAQWLADESFAGDISMGSNAALGLLWHDETVMPQPPDNLPLTHHFADKEIVIMRSGWDGDENVFAFKCGPHAGHHALRHYSQDIGGGHMCPDAGSIQLYAHGDRLLVDDGYSYKMTDQQNTVLVNGVGQTGENSEWMETTRLRLEKRGPRILRADSDVIIGDVAPAYDPELGLRKFLRHVLYLRSSCWVVIDELETADPATFSLYFHADFPFQATGHHAYATAGTHGALHITSLAPAVTARAFTHHLRAGGGHAPQSREALVLENADRTTTALFVTVLQAYPVGDTPPVPALDGLTLRLGDTSVTLQPGQSDPTVSIFTVL